MRRTVLLALPLLLLAPALVGEQEEMSSHDAAAAELLQLTKAEETMIGAIRLMVEAQVQGNPALAPYRDVLLDWVARYITWNAILPEMLRLYRETFTEAELRELIAFYRTPAGQKAVEKLPELMERGAAIGQALAQAHQGELAQMLAQRQKELEAAPPPPAPEGEAGAPK